MIVVYVLLGFAVGAVLAALVVRSTAQKRLGPANDASREAEAKKLLEAARVEAEALRKGAQIKGKEQALKIRGEIEEEVRQRKAEVLKKEEGLAVRERELDRGAREQQKRDEEVARKEKVIAQREQAADAMARQAEQALGEAKGRLEKIAGMSASEARQRLVEQVSEEAKKLAAGEVKKIEDQAAEEAQEKAKRILGTAIQRYASEYVGERTVSVVPLPSDDMKGRLIGREGRNVRALEAATGTDLIIDDTPECITISCFNPVRREVARLAIGRLVADGRIHPTRIEEVVAKCEAEVDLSCKEAGEQAVFDLGLHRVHPELVKLLGGLKYRSSYAQNLLAHSIEVGFLAGMMAGELALNVKQARRAGLFHDIGKAVDHEQEGAHAAVGAQMLKRFGEAPRVCQAVAAHHGEVEHESILDHVVDAANLISSQRPGARREQMQAYIKRLDDLEKLAKSYKGVEKAFALQMGKEVRVIVENAAVSDEAALMLSKDIAKKIETEMTYPGQVRVCVVRETRAVDYAK